MLKKAFPFLRWFQGYSLTSLQADMLAGLTVALVLPEYRGLRNSGRRVFITSNGMPAAWRAAGF